MVTRTKQNTLILLWKKFFHVKLLFFISQVRRWESYSLRGLHVTECTSKYFFRHLIWLCKTDPLTTKSSARRQRQIRQITALWYQLFRFEFLVQIIQLSPSDMHYNPSLEKGWYWLRILMDTDCGFLSAHPKSYLIWNFTVCQSKDLHMWKKVYLDFESSIFGCCLLPILFIANLLGADIGWHAFFPYRSVLRWCC